MALFFSQSQSPIECHVSFASLAHTPVVQTLYASIHLTLHKSLVLFLTGKMTSKSKNKIYKKIIKEVCKEYKGEKEFINNKIKELCVQEGLLIDEVHTWFKANLFFIMFLALKTVFCFEM